MKRPSFQFYPADWRKDPALRACSIEARGLWIDLLCIMHESENYGFLEINGQKMCEKVLARLVGETPTKLKKYLQELEDCGVFSRDSRGVIYSRRMLKDQAIRDARADGGKSGAEHGIKGKEHGYKGGRPKNERGDIKPPLNPPPSSSSSSSSSERERAHAPEEPPKQPKPPKSNPFEDRFPKAQAAEFERITKRINACNPRWRPQLTRMEMDALQANVWVLSEIVDSDWNLLRAYMHADIDPGLGKFWQPDGRLKMIESITDVLTHAEKWKSACRRAGIATGLEPDLKIA